MNTGRTKIEVIGRPAIDSIFRVPHVKNPIVIEGFGKAWDDRGTRICYAYWYEIEGSYEKVSIEKYPFLAEYVPAPENPPFTFEMVIAAKQHLDKEDAKTLFSDIILAAGRQVFEASQSTSQQHILYLILGAAGRLSNELLDVTSERNRLRDRVSQFDDNSNGVSFKLMNRLWDAELDAGRAEYELAMLRDETAFYREEIVRLTSELEEARTPKPKRTRTKTAVES